MSQVFEIVVQEESGVHLITLKGALDTATIDQFIHTMMPIMTSPRPQVIFCCKALTYLNSRSLGYFTQYHRTAMVKQGRVIFWEMSDRLLKAFDRLRVKDSLFFCDTKEEGMEKFRA